MPKSVPLVVRPLPDHPDFKNLVGKRYSRLLVESYAGHIGKHNAFHCVCDCGGKVTTRGYLLTEGSTRSCGCLLADKNREIRTTHGMANSQEYAIWRGMKNRCLNENVKSYADYGAKGVKICQRWIDGENGKTGFECFFEDVGPRPSKIYTIDRYPECDGDYRTGNVRWATRTEQQLNKSGNPRITFNGRTLQATEWETETGIPARQIHKRIGRGWTIERALTQPLRAR